MKNLFPTEKSLSPADFGPLESVMAKIFALQSGFLSDLNTLTVALNTSPTAQWSLIGVSFAYGVFHALGPGHGKAIVSAWATTDSHTIKKGIFVASMSALLQSLSAITLVSVFFLILGKTAFALNNTTALLSHISGWILIFIALTFLLRSIRTLFSNSTQEPACGCAHHATSAALTPKNLFTKSFSATLPVILSVGIRPCTGAILVLTLAFTTNHHMIGIFSVLAMGLGTAITVSMIVSGVIGLKNVRIVSLKEPWRQRAHAVLFGALSVFFASFGLSLLMI